MGKFKDTGGIINGTSSADLGALAAQAAVKIDAITLAEDFRLLKAEVMGTIDGATAGDLNGLVFGIADGELSGVEIAECLTAVPNDRNDNLANERAKRPVWTMGMVESFGVETETRANIRGESGGPLMVWKKRWIFSDPEGWDYFIFNNGDKTLNTGADCRVIATHYGLWVT